MSAPEAFFDHYSLHVGDHLKTVRATAQAIVNQAAADAGINGNVDHGEVWIALRDTKLQGSSRVGLFYRVGIGRFPGEMTIEFDSIYQMKDRYGELVDWLKQNAR